MIIIIDGYWKRCIFPFPWIFSIVANWIENVLSRSKLTVQRMSNSLNLTQMSLFFLFRTNTITNTQNSEFDFDFNIYFFRLFFVLRKKNLFRIRKQKLKFQKWKIIFSSSDNDDRLSTMAHNKLLWTRFKNL